MSKLLSKFKSLMQSGRSEFTLAYRPLFFLWFEFDNVNFYKKIKKSDISLEDISYLVQAIDLPNFQIDSDDSIDVKNVLGSFKGIGNVNIVPERNDVSITFLDTEKPVFESVFVPWVQEVVNVKTTGEGYPFTRGKINVDLYSNDSKDVMLRYIIDGVYPNHIDSPNLRYGKNEDVTRTIGFNFNKVNVEM